MSLTIEEKELLFKKLFIEQPTENYKQIASAFKIERKELTDFYSDFIKERTNEIAEIKRIKQLFNNKCNIHEKKFCFENFESFYEWYLKQYKEQDGKCYYCKTHEKIIAELMKQKYSHRKRLNRGNYLEVERKNASRESNIYNSENCVLACYFCNNDKSDIFDETEYLDYLKDRKSFFEKQVALLNTK